MAENEESTDDFYFLSWNQLGAGKQERKEELVQGFNPELLIDNMKEMHRQKRLSTSDYRTVNLSKLLEKQGLRIVE